MDSIQKEASYIIYLILHCDKNSIFTYYYIYFTSPYLKTQSREMSNRLKSKNERNEELGEQGGSGGGGNDLKAASPRERGMTKRADNNVAHSRNKILALVPSRCDRACPRWLLSFSSCFLTRRRRRPSGDDWWRSIR